MAGTTTGGGGFTAAVVNQIIAPGILVAATAYTETDILTPYQTWVTFDVTRGGDDSDKRIFNLGGAYISKEVPATVQTFFELRESDQIRAYVRGNTTPVIRIKYFLLTQTAKGQVIEFLRAATHTT